MKGPSGLGDGPRGSAELGDGSLGCLGFSNLSRPFGVFLFTTEQFFSAEKLSFHSKLRSWLLPISQQFLNFHPPICRITDHASSPGLISVQNYVFVRMNGGYILKGLWI